MTTLEIISNPTFKNKLYGNSIYLNGQKVVITEEQKAQLLIVCNFGPFHQTRFGDVKISIETFPVACQKYIARKSEVSHWQAMLEVFGNPRLEKTIEAGALTHYVYSLESEYYVVSENSKNNSSMIRNITPEKFIEICK